MLDIDIPVAERVAFDSCALFQDTHLYRGCGCRVCLLVGCWNEQECLASTQQSTSSYLAGDSFLPTKIIRRRVRRTTFSVVQTSIRKRSVKGCTVRSTVHSDGSGVRRIRGSGCRPPITGGGVREPIAISPLRSSRPGRYSSTVVTPSPPSCQRQARGAEATTALHRYLLYSTTQYVMKDG